MFAMQSSDILRKRAFPRNRYGQEQRIERRVVEPFAEVSPGRQNKALFAIRCFQPGFSGAPSLRLASAASAA